MFLRDLLYLGNNGGGPTQRDGRLQFIYFQDYIVFVQLVWATLIPN